MPTRINYDPTVNANSGYLEILDAPQDPTKPPASVDPNRPGMRPQDKQTLLHLLFWLCSDVRGRDFIGRWSTWRGEKASEADIKIELRKEFRARLGPNKDDLIEALIEGHLAADRFVQATNNNDQDAAAIQERLYLKNMAIVMWHLNEDVSGHEFSLLW